MTLDLSKLDQAHRLLFEIPLKPVQGSRFQPTGFPGLGAATYQTAEGSCLLVESAQSMANRLELTIWDEATNRLKPGLEGLSHVTVRTADGGFLTDTILESHRLNSPYVLNAKLDGELFFEALGSRLKAFETGPIDRRSLAGALLKLDVSSLVHGLFLSANINKKTLAGGRLRVARALSAFIEANGVRVAPSGGVKNDHVNPSGETKAGFGNVPFARDEFTAERITLYVNLDLAQIRGYGLGADAERLLILLALYKLRALLDGNLRLRTACDLCVAAETVTASAPEGVVLPHIDALASGLKSAIEACMGKMSKTEVTYLDKIDPAKGNGEQSQDDVGDHDDNGGD